MLLFIKFLRFYRAPGASSPTIAAPASRRKIVYAALALLIFVPIILMADGCGGDRTCSAEKLARHSKRDFHPGHQAHS
jgi:hypothetical protein